MRPLLLHFIIIGFLSSCATTSMQRGDPDPSDSDEERSSGSQNQRSTNTTQQPTLRILPMESRDGATVRPLRPDEGIRADQDFAMYFSTSEPLYLYVAAMSSGDGMPPWQEVLYPPKGESTSPVFGTRQRVPAKGGWLRPSRDSNKLLILASSRPLSIDATTDEASITAARRVSGVTARTILLTQPVSASLESAHSLGTGSPGAQPVGLGSGLNADSAGKKPMTASEMVRDWKWSLPFTARDVDVDDAPVRELEVGEVLHRGGSYALHVDVSEPAYVYIMGVNMDGQLEVVFPFHGQPQQPVQGARVRIPAVKQWLKPRSDLFALLCVVTKRRMAFDSLSENETRQLAAAVMKIHPTFLLSHSPRLLQILFRFAGSASD